MKQWKLAAVAAALGAALAMPVVAQDKSTSGASQGAQSQSAQQQAQPKQDTRSAAGGQSSPSDLGMQNQGDEGSNWGWLGLLGLIGLAGLRRNRDEHRYSTTTGRP